MSTPLYQQIYDDVVILTGRPDLADETALAVRTATRSIHNRAHFPRDVVSSLVQLPNAVYQVALDTQVLFSRFRGASTLRALDVNSNPLSYPEIEVVELGDIYDPVYGNLRNNIAYQAGTALNVRTSIAISGLIVEYFSSPDVSPSVYSSWIAQLAPDVITYQAASFVATATGNEEKSQKWQATVDKLLFPELISNYLTSAAR